MSMLSEFKQFAIKGNVLDLAIGVVVGVAFGAITASLVNDVIMPPLGILISGVDFAHLKFIIKPADAAGAGEVAILWGKFMLAVFNFTIIAGVMFMVVKGINTMKRKQEEAPAEPSAEVKLLTEIRDSLRTRG